MNALLAIARTEARLGFRNSWVLLSTVILTLFAVLLVLLGSGASGQVDAPLLSVSIASLSTLSVYLIPLIALLLSFDAIAGEIDRGTLQLVLATPIPRWQLLAGKFLGHLAVLSIAIIVSSGIAAALAIALDDQGGAQPLGDLAALTATSILPETREALHVELEKACRIVEPLGGSIEFELFGGYPSTSNSPEATQVAVDALAGLLGSENVKLADQGMGGEDFSYMSEVAPGCFVRLGVHDPAWGDKKYNVHRADFRMDEDALPIGAAALAAAALNWMNQKR